MSLNFFTRITLNQRLGIIKCAVRHLTDCRYENLLKTSPSLHLWPDVNELNVDKNKTISFPSFWKNHEHHLVLFLGDKNLMDSILASSLNQLKISESIEKHREPREPREPRAYTHPKTTSSPSFCQNHDHLLGPFLGDNTLTNSILVPSFNQLNINEDIIKKDPEKPNAANNEMLLHVFIRPKKYRERADKKHRDPKAYTHLTIIRRKKMKKHKLKKWRKKYLAQIKKYRLRKEIKKEKLFRAELLAQIKEAEDFDPQKYVENILKTIDSMPVPQTDEQKLKVIKELIRKNKSQTIFMAKEFDD